MSCPKCKGEVEKGSAQCPHCGVKFVVKPRPPQAASAKSEMDEMFGAEAPPPPPPPPDPRGGRMNRVIDTGRPSTMGTNIIADNIRGIIGIVIALLVLAGIAVRVIPRMSREKQAVSWTVVNDEVALQPGRYHAGLLKWDSNGPISMQVASREGPLLFGMRPFDGEKPQDADFAGVVGQGKRLESGKHDRIEETLPPGRYLWVVQNPGDRLARAKIIVMGAEK